MSGSQWVLCIWCLTFAHRDNVVKCSGFFHSHTIINHWYRLYIASIAYGSGAQVDKIIWNSLFSINFHSKLNNKWISCDCVECFYISVCSVILKSSWSLECSRRSPYAWCKQCIQWFANHIRVSLSESMSIMMN